MKGAREMAAKLAMIRGALDADAFDAAVKAGEHVLGVSRDQTPIEEGTLERSGRVTVPPVAGDGKATATISYHSPYAVVQHEDLTFAHDPGRTAKFLENALNSERTTCQRILLTSTQTMLRRVSALERRTRP